MAQATGGVLSSTEATILTTLREIPDGPLKSRLEEFLVELTDKVARPGCAEMQADGIPCDSATADCEECLMLEQMLKTLRSTIPQR